ncbi:MAG TPA: hypothetical protein VKP88_07535 [Candidatus Paceibacterota bacterium]|nr:hypothetical protein [Candidatus Paceibacterota bacterium]
MSERLQPETLRAIQQARRQRIDRSERRLQWLENIAVVLTMAGISGIIAYTIAGLLDRI